jgi:hypothetical protein
VRAYLGLLDGRSPSDQTHIARRRSRATTDYGLNTSNTAPSASLLVIERVQELAVFCVQFADHPSNTEPEPGVAVRVTVDPKGKLPMHWAGATVDHYGGRDGAGTRHRSGAVTHLVNSDCWKNRTRRVKRCGCGDCPGVWVCCQGSDGDRTTTNRCYQSYRAYLRDLYIA